MQGKVAYTALFVSHRCGAPPVNRLGPAIRLRASSRRNIAWPSHCSITAEPSRWFDRLEVGEIEFDNRTQGLGRCAVLLIIG